MPIIIRLLICVGVGLGAACVPYFADKMPSSFPSFPDVKPEVDLNLEVLPEKVVLPAMPGTLKPEDLFMCQCDCWSNQHGPDIPNQDGN